MEFKINHSTGDIREAMGIKPELESIFSEMDKNLSGVENLCPSDIIQYCVDAIAKIDTGNGAKPLSEYEMSLMFMGILDGESLDKLLTMKEQLRGIEDLKNMIRGNDEKEE